MIKHVSLKHGWFYHYRVHLERIDSLHSNIENLKSYLLDNLESCPDEPFQKGPRSSSAKFSLPITTNSAKGHELCTWAVNSKDNDRYKTAHSKVQMTMLHHDKNTIAVEVPIWSNLSENKEIAKIMPESEDFDSSSFLSGHIDILRIENNKIWIWDYKPKAEKEKFATTQVFLYSLMLSERTSVPLENFLCGYFDEKDCFMFDPNRIKN